MSAFRAGVVPDDRTCPFCFDDFTPAYSDQRYCSREHQRKAASQRKLKKPPWLAEFPPELEAELYADALAGNIPAWKEMGWC